MIGAAPTIQLVSSQLGATLVAVHLDHVEQIEDRPVSRKAPKQNPGDGVQAVCDVARLWGLSAPPEEHSRRVLVVKQAGDPLRVVVGTSTTVTEITAADLHQLPTLVAGLSALAAISGIFVLAGRLGLLLDPERLAELEARGGQP